MPILPQKMANAAIKKVRPKYLSLAALLFEIRLPLPGWVSILHRVSGVLLFAGTAWLLFLLDRSLQSAAGFESVRTYLAHPLVKIALLALIWSYCHHFCAGIRFLLLDVHVGVEKQAARRSGVAVIVVALVLTVLFGARLL
jgi:succinate dehydrogenase / fumarate reductase cytochrome b subunit